MTSGRMLMIVLIAAAVCMASVGVGAADEVNVTLEGQFGGATHAVAVSGNYAYIEQVRDLVVLDISSPASPVELGRVTTPDFIYGVAVSGDYAYVANDYSGLAIVDVSNKAAPVLAGSYDTAGDALDVAVSDGYVYVADEDNGLAIVDVSNKAAPVLAGSYDTAGWADGVTVSGDYAYVADNNKGLVIVDVSNKAAPTLAGSYDTAGYAECVAVSDDYAYVADQDNGLVIVDVSNKAAPALAGRYDTAEGDAGGYSCAWSVAVSGDYAYVATWYNGLVIVDVSNKAAPTLAGSYDTGDAHDVAVSGDYVYVADQDNGFLILRTDASGADATPPTLTITAPSDDTTVSTPTITVAGTASDASGIASVTVNGALATGTTSWSAEVTLTEGENTITVVATDGAGLTTTETITVWYEPLRDDNFNVTFEGRFGGDTDACAVSGDYAYIGQGQDLVVLDVSNPASPVVLGRIMTSGMVCGVTVSGNYAYVADQDNGLVIVDVSNKAAPLLAGSYDTVGWVDEVAVSGGYAYVADQYGNGLVIVDVSNKAAPLLAGSCDTAGRAYGVAVSGDYAYVTTGSNGLLIVDVSDKATPALAGSYDTAGRAIDVAVSGDYAYVADGDNGLVIVDITEKSTPTLAGSYDTGYARGVAVADDYAYVADWDNGIVIVNVSNKSEPALAGSYDTGHARGVALSGDYAYVADWDNGIVIVDITDKSEPALAGSYGTAGYARDVAVSDDYAYVAGASNGIVVVDVSSKTAPVLTGSCDTWTDGVTVSGNYAYVVEEYTGIRIVDISNKAAPVLVGSYDTTGWVGDYVAVSGNYAYVVDWYGLRIIDISNKAAPVLAGSYETDEYAEDVAVSGDYAYVAEDWTGLRIIDISNKAAPVLAGSCHITEGWLMAEDVAVSGDCAYVTNCNDGLAIVDISNKAAPVLAGSYDIGGGPEDVVVSGDYAYIANGWDGLVIVDISNKAAPVLAGSYDTAGYALGVAVSGDYVYVADESNGLVILRMDASGADATPPALTITSPADGTTTHSPTITIAGTASDPSGIAEVTANGVLADGAADWSTWSAEVTLTEGENTITVVATNTTGGSTTKAMTITYTPILDGKVLSSSTNDGIENATVTLVETGKTAQTGTNGYYSFSGVADGSYTLTASKLGYIFSPVDVVVSETTRASPIMGSLDTTVINATITSTVMPSGSFKPGDSVEVAITAKNTGTIEHTFYIGYSVRDPDDTFWDALYVPVTLSPGEIATETLRWTVQPGAPAGSYDVYTAAWATQHWSCLYDNLDRENAYEVFSVQPNPEHIPGWTFNDDERYDVLVDSEKYTAVLSINDPNRYISWMVYDSDGKVPDLTTFQHAAKTTTVAAMAGSDTTDEVAGLRRVQESMNEFTGWISLAKFALWARNAGAYLTGKLVLLASTGGTSLTTEIPASVVRHEIAMGLSEKILKDLTPGASNLKDIVSAYAIIKVQHSASKLGTAADTLEEYDGGLWTYHEANMYYDNYKYGVIDGMTYMTLTSELQPGSDFVSQMCGVCNEVLKGATYGIIDFGALTVVELANSIEDLDAVKYSAITREKYKNRFDITDARFGANAIELWDAYQTANKVSGCLMCPGNLHAYDSQGRHVGVNSTGGIDLEIPNSYYSGPDAEPEIINIYTPQDDNITFCVDNATTTGMFDLTLEKQMNMTMDTVCYLNIPITETTAISVNTNNSSNPDCIMEVDSDGDGVVDRTVNPNSTETNHKPVSRINPPTQIVFAEGYPVLITGNGTDVEEGELSEDALTWTSSIDGMIGSGSMLNTTNLSIGNHTIVLTVIDSNGAMSMDSIEIRIYMVTTGELVGDLNHDGILTPADVAIALQLAASGGWDPAADVNHDSRITSLDALMIMQAAM